MKEYTEYCAKCGVELLVKTENGEMIEWEGHYWEPGEVTDSEYFECDTCRGE